MLSANASTIQALRGDNRVFTYAVTVNGTTDITASVLNASITESGASTHRLGIGEFCKSQCTLTVLADAVADWYHTYFTVTVTINSETIPLGKFYVPSGEIRNVPGIVSITGYDTSWLWDDPFVYTTTSSSAIITAIETYTGQTITNKNLLTNVTVPIVSTSDDPLTYLEMMSYIAGLEGYNIRNNRLGNFELYKYFTGTAYDVEYDEIFENGISYDLTETEITSYEISNDVNTFIQGSGYGIQYHNPLITSAEASAIDDYLGESYTASDISFKGNPLLQIGDTIAVFSGETITTPAYVGQAEVGHSAVGITSIDEPVPDFVLPIMEQSFTLDGGLSQNVHAYSEFNSIEYQTPAQRFTEMKVQMGNFSSELIQTNESISTKVSYEEYDANNNLIDSQMSQIEQRVTNITATVNEMNASLNDQGLQIYDTGDTVTTITGDGLKVNVLEDVGLNGAILGEELLSATSDGVTATRLTAKETLAVRSDLYYLIVKPFYNSTSQLQQIGFYAMAMEE